MDDDCHWNLSSFAGVEVSINPTQSDDKVYTLILKDKLLPRSPLTAVSNPRSDGNPASPSPKAIWSLMLTPHVLQAV